MFSVDKPVALLGVGLCGTEGGLTAELELYEVDAEDFRRVAGGEAGVKGAGLGAGGDAGLWGGGGCKHGWKSGVGCT